MQFRQPYVYLIFVWACVFAVMTLSGCTSVPNKHADSVYISSNSPMQDVQNALNKAKADDKLLLITMGAQWCHDSRGLAENFKNPAMLEILEQDYELIYVDVGYYKDLRAISNRFGQAHYFATPTVMIVDPESEQLMNAGDMAMWGSADSLPFETYLDYFTKYTMISVKELQKPHAGVSAEYILAILDFENQNAERLQYAYGILVPDMIKEDLTGKLDETFAKRWVEVRSYRMNLQKDIQDLYKQAKASPNDELTFPEYPAFSWEK